MREAIPKQDTDQLSREGVRSDARIEDEVVVNNVDESTESSSLPQAQDIDALDDTEYADAPLAAESIGASQHHTRYLACALKWSLYHRQCFLDGDHLERSEDMLAMPEQSITYLKDLAVRDKLEPALSTILPTDLIDEICERLSWLCEGSPDHWERTMRIRAALQDVRKESEKLKSLMEEEPETFRTADPGRYQALRSYVTTSLDELSESLQNVPPGGLPRHQGVVWIVE